MRVNLSLAMAIIDVIDTTTQMRGLSSSGFFAEADQDAIKGCW